VETAQEVVDGATEAVETVLNFEAENAELKIFDTLLASIRTKRKELLTEYTAISQDYADWALSLYKNDEAILGNTISRGRAIELILEG
jgi:hypothetical protein